MNDGEPFSFVVAELDENDDPILDENGAFAKSAPLDARTTEATISNTVESERIGLTVVKTWEGEPLGSATIDLLADGVVVETITLDADTQWTHTFSHLLKFDPETGEEIVYTVREHEVPGYTSVVTELDTSLGYRITNTIVPPAEETTPPTPPTEETTPPTPPTPPAPPTQTEIPRTGDAETTAFLGLGVTGAVMVLVSIRLLSRA